MRPARNKIRARVGTVGATGFAKKPSGKIWPHGEWSLGYAKAPMEPTDYHAENDYWRLEPPSKERSSPLLDSPEEFSQGSSADREKKKYGLKGITGYGRKMVQSGVAVMAERLGQRRLVFCTLTLPPLSPEGRVAVAESWGETLRQLIQWLTRRLEVAGLPKAVVSVSEIQPARLSKTGEGYLHLHLAWPSRRSTQEGFAVDIRELRAWWETRIARVCNLPSVPTTQIKIETVRSNVSAYMAKYMSKGAEGLAAYKADCGLDGIPSQWWNMSKQARDWTFAAVCSGATTGELLENMVNGLFDGCWETWPGGIRAVTVDIDGHKMTVGYAGYFDPPTLADLTSMLKSGLSQIDTH